MHSHFDLFGLAPAFRLDQDRLEGAYREIQSRVHPDRFASAGDAERRASLQWTTRVNEAYRTLRDPVQRGKHLLALHGVDVAFETNTAMPQAFLVQQMELREKLEAARDAASLDSLKQSLRAERSRMEQSVACLIDDEKDYASAAEEVRKLLFLQRLDEEIDAAYEAVE